MIVDTNSWRIHDNEVLTLSHQWCWEELLQKQKYSFDWNHCDMWIGLILSDAPPVWMGRKWEGPKFGLPWSTCQQWEMGRDELKQTLLTWVSQLSVKKQNSSWYSNLNSFEIKMNQYLPPPHPTHTEFSWKDRNVSLATQRSFPPLEPGDML